MVMLDTPENVFSRSQELLDMGLDIPQITRVFLHLRQMGVNVPQVYTMEQAVSVLKSLKGGCADA
jgi:energy-coupling factor transport system ATP-binding protein